MFRITILLLFICSSFGSFAQVTDTKIIKPSIDSLEELKLLMELLDSIVKPKSYIEISVGIGNKLFSEKNNTINASQTEVNKLYYTPTLAYHYKNGFSISVTPYLTSDKGAIKLYQTALSPSYDFSNKKVSMGISYTHYFSDRKAYNPNAIFKNDLYGSIKYKKWFLAPSLSIGYATGNFNEINAIGTSRIFYDTTKNIIRDFSLSAIVDHQFEFENIFNKNDGISITPQLMLNAGSEKFTTTHTNKIFASLPRRANKVRPLSQTANSPFTIQSLALALSAAYFIKNFSIQPNIYADYYLPQTTQQRLNTVFAITIGYTF
jgi:hypothetical protein